MQRDEPILDSPVGWVADHIQTYVETNGKKGHHWRGVKTLLLTTRGRRTGQLRRSALIYGEDNGHYVVVASNGGKPENPLWYGNLKADPHVTLQVGPEIFAANARDATPEERPRLMAMMKQIFATYADYEKKTKPSREIPIVVLERVSPD